MSENNKELTSSQQAAEILVNQQIELRNQGLPNKLDSFEDNRELLRILDTMAPDRSAKINGLPASTIFRMVPLKEEKDWINTVLRNNFLRSNPMRICKGCGHYKSTMDEPCDVCRLAS